MSTTEAQRARNARKRAKLKAHKKAKSAYAVKAYENVRYVVSCREQELWISWTHTEVFRSDFYPDSFACPDEVVESWVDHVLSKFGPGQSKIVPGSFQVSLEVSFNEQPTAWDDLTCYMNERDLAALLERRAVELNRVA